MTRASTFVKQAILFDLDGVLVDSTASVARTWRTWAEHHNLDPEKIISAAHGRRTIETVREFAPHLDPEAEAVKLEKTEAHDHEGLQLVAGARELIAQIPDGRWAICTSGTGLLAMARLRAVGLPIPRVLISADAVANGKPHPEPYLRTAERLGYRAEDCLVIEDSPAGILAGKSAGASVIGVATTYPVSELTNAHTIVRDLRPIEVKMEGPRLRIAIAE